MHSKIETNYSKLPFTAVRVRKPKFETPTQLARKDDFYTIKHRVRDMHLKIL
jgi:hypothetical protein